MSVAAANDNGRRTADRTVLQSVQRASRVLNEVAHRRGPVTIGEIAAALQLDRTIVHRLVKTLTGEGLLEQAGDGYRVGRGSLLLGNAYIDDLAVRRVALPYQVSLLDRVLRDRPWTIALVIPIGNEAAIVDTVWNVSAPLEIVLAIGRRLPIAKTAAGKAMLAYHDPATVQALIGRDAAEAAEAELAAIRDARGLAFVKDFVPGGSAVGAAIFNRAGDAIAALSLSGLELEDQLDVSSNVAQTLRRTADAISQNLP